MSLTQESLTYAAEEHAFFPAENQPPSRPVQEPTSFSAEHANWHSAQSSPQFTESPAPSYLPQETVPFSAHHSVPFSTPDGDSYSIHPTTSYPAQPATQLSPYYNPTLTVHMSTSFPAQNGIATSQTIDVSAIGKSVEEQLAHADLLMSFNQYPINGANVKKTRRRRAPANTIEKKPRKPRAKRVSIFDNSFAGLDKSQRISASIEAVIRHAMTDAELKDRGESPQNSYDSGYDHQAETDHLKEADGDTSGSFNMMMTHICNSYCENLELSGVQPSLQCEESISNDESSGQTGTDKAAPSQGSSTSPPKQTGGALQTLCDAARIFRGPSADGKHVKRTRRTYRRRNLVQPEDDSSISSHSEASFVEPVNTADFVVPPNTPQKAYSVPPNTPDNSVPAGPLSDSYRVMDAGLVRPQSTYTASASFMQPAPAACFNECCTTQPHYQQQQSAFQTMTSPYGLSPFANVNPFIPPPANSLGYLNTMNRLAAGPLGGYNPMMLSSQQIQFGVSTQFSPAQLLFLDALPPVVNAHVREMSVGVWMELQRGRTHGQIYQNLMFRNPTMGSAVAPLLNYSLQLINLGLQSAPMPPMQPMAQLAPVTMSQSAAAQSYESQYS